MGTVTGTTVEVMIGEYTYRAEVDGNRVELFRDGVSAGAATWSGHTIENFPRLLAQDAHDELDVAIRENLGKAWRAEPTVTEMKTAPVHAPPGAAGADEGRTPDAGNAGQLGADGRIARQGEKEVGAGGPGHDDSTGEVGGQTTAPGRGPKAAKPEARDS
jgi:hypothetical protein